MSLEGKSEGDEVGMTLYMKCHTHYDMSLVRNANGKVVLRLRYRIGELSHVEKEVETTGKDVTVRLEGSAELYYFSYSSDGKNFSSLGKLNPRFISTVSGG